MSYTYMLNGLDAGRWAVLADSTHQLDVSMDRKVVAVPGRAGEMVVSSVPTAPAMALVLAPRGSDVEAQIDDMAALLASPTLTVRRVTPSSTREAVASLIGHNWDPNRLRRGARAVVTVSLSLPGVYWRDTTATTTALVAGSTALDVGSAPVTDAVVRFALDAANPVLTDAQTGTGISVAHDAVATDYIYVDCGQLQAWTSASSSQWTRPSSSAQWLDALVSYPGPGPLRMTPAVTESGGVLSRLATLTSSHTASVQFKKAWW